MQEKFEIGPAQVLALGGGGTVYFTRVGGGRVALDLSLLAAVDESPPGCLVTLSSGEKITLLEPAREVVRAKCAAAAHGGLPGLVTR